MAFPNTPIITTFPGADEEPLSEGGAWGGPIRPTIPNLAKCALGGVGGHRIVRSSTATSTSESVYLTTYGADQEVYLTAERLGSSGQELVLHLRVQNENSSSVKSYLLSYKVGTGWQFYRLSNTTYTSIGGIISTQAISAGDSMGASVTGTTLQGWYKASGGSWVSQGTQTDSNVTGAGKLAVEITAGSNWEGSNFGGGTAGQVILPDADLATTGWATAPLFSKINDSSDATVITATAS